jgi:hypothetical protein
MDAMPEGYLSSVRYPDRREHWLDRAAANGELVVCRCQTCRRFVRYLAADLLPILGPAHRVMVDPPFPCRCGERSLITIKCMTPVGADYGLLDIRRPVIPAHRPKDPLRGVKVVGEG